MLVATKSIFSKGSVDSQCLSFRKRKTRFEQKGKAQDGCGITEYGSALEFECAECGEDVSMESLQ